ncbi:MAG: glucose 1-dehydrogenase [Bacteroidota bacterium]
MSIIQSFNLSGKVAIVTGASKGIGKAIARAYAEQGASVIVSSRKQEAVDAVAAELQSEGLAATGVACNMGDMEAIAQLVKSSQEVYGGLDVVVNNAAANPVFGPLHESDGEVFDKIMQVNVKGPFELVRLAHPYMKSRGGGSVINVSSVGGLSPEHMLGIYSVSKAALISLTKVQARELGGDGIRANVICPGLIKTKFSQALWTNDSLMKGLMRQLPIARVGTPEEVAGLALFLASEAAGYCTGGIYTADGGYTI